MVRYSWRAGCSFVRSTAIVGRLLFRISLRLATTRLTPRLLTASLFFLGRLRAAGGRLLLILILAAASRLSVGLIRIAGTAAIFFRTGRRFRLILGLAASVLRRRLARIRLISRLRVALRLRSALWLLSVVARLGRGPNFPRITGIRCARFRSLALWVVAAGRFVRIIVFWLRAAGRAAGFALVAGRALRLLGAIAALVGIVRLTTFLRTTALRAAVLVAALLFLFLLLPDGEFSLEDWSFCCFSISFAISFIATAFCPGSVRLVL